LVSRIRVFEWRKKHFFIPVTCRQCEDAPCMAACPKDAIYRDTSLYRVMVDYSRCISCRMCVAACPFGAMGFDPHRQRVFKCDLCGGEPQCVRFCYPGALTYMPAARVPQAQIRHAAQRKIGIQEKKA
jgi:Fe-S-cluster-containing hydrogenase component 2